MSDFSTFQFIILGLLFIWSGFIRSGLGFGGTALALPLMLLLADDPLLFLPLLSIQLLFFSSVIMWQSHRQTKKQRLNGQQAESSIDWKYLWQSLRIMLIPKLIGVLGLITLPPKLISSIIFFIILIYALSYILDKPFQSNRPWSDKILLTLGAYTSGTSLMGAPLIIAVYSSHVARHQLRDTLFVLWWILVVLKIASFLVTGVDMQWQQQLWLLPCGLIGHMIGLQLHKRLQQARSVAFYRVTGVALLLVGIVGLGRIFMGFE